MSQPLCAIVGAGQGLGQSLAAKFASEGFDLALISRTRAGCKAAQVSASNANPTVQVKYFQADVTFPQSVEGAFTAITSEMGAVDVLIYNVRSEFTKCEPLKMSYEALEAIFRTEVTGAFAAAKSVLPAMIERGQGSIFFSSATAAFRGSDSYPLYAIGKFGVRALSQSLAKAYSKDGVHIVHVRLDCDLDVPVMKELYGDGYDPNKLADPNGVAQSYWLTFQQPRSAWSNEIELRPFAETWTY
ncbi:SDR family NAD(P)-dependent oxidoreductase [Alphaproteobacteria bacterium]|nr:SDR family NAD(P)-dependent oxidoreductase [Alphaproteobacteria bacterium]